jgi:hypothetical protein
MDITIQVLEINTQMSPTTGGSNCMENHKNTEAWELKYKEAQEGTLKEEQSKEGSEEERSCK